MTTPVTFSVVVPTFRRTTKVIQAMESVRASRNVSVELIVVENGSDFATKTFLSERIKSDTYVDLSINLGPGGARNRGAEVANGQYLLFLDSDDELYPYSLATFQNVLASHPLDMLYGAPGENQNIGATGPLFQVFDDFLDERNPFIVAFPSGMVIQRSIFLESGGFVEGTDHMEDLDLWFRMGTNTRFGAISSPHLFKRNEGNDSRSLDLEFSFRAISNLIEREFLGVYRGTEQQEKVRKHTIEKVVEYYCKLYAESTSSKLSAELQKVLSKISR